uniref:EGF-like domain-containing protein n=1 Tax=Ficedula albicollis TaxID=59894 RepID=A0A803V450_FICAL
PKHALPVGNFFGGFPTETLFPFPVPAADVCDSNPCQNGGICLSGLNDNFYSCECPQGFTDPNCSSLVEVEEKGTAQEKTRITHTGHLFDFQNSCPSGGSDYSLNECTEHKSNVLTFCDVHLTQTKLKFEQ